MLLPPRAASDAEAAAWFAIDALPPLAFDHREIIIMAQQRLRSGLDTSTIAFQLLPVEFALSQLQSVYEAIQQQSLDKRNFCKRMLAREQIEESGGVNREGRQRPARLYRLIHPDSASCRSEPQK